MASLGRYDLPFRCFLQSALEHLKICSRNCCEFTASVLGPLVWYDLPFQVFVQRALDHLENCPVTFVSYRIVATLGRYDLSFQVFVQRALDHLGEKIVTSSYQTQRGWPALADTTCPSAVRPACSWKMVRYIKL